ncbi:TLP18.3/Psb32/MOLO-1 phosphatase superfamily protein [Panacagrimonas perspica]|uniref:TLP18.3/Psb32/MOLO-1 phosphatase superfamily protein n=2 Tax=Panacagrimonas perspica TaxID=381431 RepID=A0A4S3K6X8_9GAMM|nr:TLP18.3/Psb32/MOLO-1 phosphatase superfamily protein [Panacagrimonas perspica]THD03942.1 hypothetical protein B1810_06650 [Panacagrimonas perspica]
MVTSMKRWWRHLTTGSLARRRAFPGLVMQQIESAIRECESRHTGEIRFAVDTALSFAELSAGMSPRECAIEAFSKLRVWDTAHNNGVLIYVLLADRDVEIVADRGVGNSRVPPSEWEACCHAMEAHFRRSHFRDGAVAGIRAVADVLGRYPPEPRVADAGNELPDAPALL